MASLLCFYYYILKFEFENSLATMPPNSRAKKTDAKIAVKQYLKSIKNMGYQNIACFKCHHKWFKND